LSRTPANRFLWHEEAVARHCHLGVFAVAPTFGATRGVEVTRAGFTPSKLTVDDGDNVTNRDNTASFGASVPRRSRLRLLLMQDQAGTCYAATRSGVVRA
jgi:hypothetical protein